MSPGGAIAPLAPPPLHRQGPLHAASTSYTPALASTAYHSDGQYSQLFPSGLICWHAWSGMDPCHLSFKNTISIATNIKWNGMNVCVRVDTKCLFYAYKASSSSGSKELDSIDIVQDAAHCETEL